MNRLDPEVCRAALDLVAARHQDEYAVFEVVLDELATESAGLGVLGVFVVTHLSLRQASIIAQHPVSRVLGGLRVEAVPAARSVVPAVLTLLHTAAENLPEASQMARRLGADDRATPSMVVLADVSIAMAERLTAFCGVPEAQVITSWRQQVEHLAAADTWAA